MKALNIPFLFVFICFLSRAVLSSPSPHSPVSVLSSLTRAVDTPSANHLPPPWLDAGGVCRPLDGSRSVDATAGLCDPSGLLSSHREAALNAKLASIYLGQPPYSLISCGSAPPSAGFRVAVLIIRRMPSSYSTASSSAAKTFSDAIFSRWSLGTNCRASVLVFVSLEDRKMYIKTGAFAARYLTETKINSVFSVMAPSLASGYVYNALDQAIDAIGNVLQVYQAPGNSVSTPAPQQVPGKATPQPAPQTGTAPEPTKKDNNNRPFAPLFWKSGPEWFDLEMSLIVIAAGVCIVFACCNGMGGPDAARAKRERRHVLQKLGIIQMEYIRSTMPDYRPCHCPVCQDDLSMPMPVASTSSQQEANTEANPLLSSSTAVPAVDNDNDGTNGVKTFRCGHAFHTICLQTIPSMNENPWRCPICFDTPGVDEVSKPLADSRTEDFRFRLEHLRQQFPHIITPAVFTRIAATSPATWPDTLEESFLRAEDNFSSSSNTTGDRGYGQSYGHEHGEGGGGGGRRSGVPDWLGSVGGMLAAGGLGAIIGSAVTNANNNNNDNNDNSGGSGGGVPYAGTGQQDTAVGQSWAPADGGQGASFGQWGNQEQQLGQGDGGHGVSFGGNWFAQQQNSSANDGGFGAGWGGLSSTFAQTQGGDSGWAGGSSQDDGGGGDDGGGEGDF